MDLLIALAVVFAGVAAVSVFLVLRRDVGTRRAVAAGAVAAVAVGVGWFFILYLALFALAAAIGTYLLTRHRISTGHAMTAAAVTYAGLAAVSGAAFYAAIGTM